MFCLSRSPTPSSGDGRNCVSKVVGFIPLSGQEEQSMSANCWGFEGCCRPSSNIVAILSCNSVCKRLSCCVNTCDPCWVEAALFHAAQNEFSIVSFCSSVGRLELTSAVVYFSSCFTVSYTWRRALIFMVPLPEFHHARCIFLFSSQWKSLVQNIQTQEEHPWRHPPIWFDETCSRHFGVGKSQISRHVTWRRRSKRMGRCQQ